MLPSVVQKFVTDVIETFPAISGKLKSYVDELEHGGKTYGDAAERIFGLADALATSRGWEREDILDHYAEFVIEYLREQARFISTGEFSNEGRSFEDIKAEVYEDEEHMLSYMYGLLISYALFPHHYAQYRFFLDVYLPLVPKNGRCVEFGSGHGLFMAETLAHSPDRFVEGYDVSPAALQLSKDLLAASQCPPGHFLIELNDVVKKTLPADKYDAMVATGLLEHIPDPEGFLRRMRDKLASDGHFFVMLPVNVAHADHMILFHEPSDCRKLMQDTGFKLVAEEVVPTEDLPPEELKAQKVPIIYLGVFQKTEPGTA